MKWGDARIQALIETAKLLGGVAAGAFAAGMIVGLIVSIRSRAARYRNE